jgi:hypothetical protein
MRVLSSLTVSVVPFFIVIISSLVLRVNPAYGQKWKEVDDFHWTLAFTYHPLEDENNFEPIRNRSEELYERAVAIQKAAIPSCVNDVESAKQLIDSLVTKTKMLDEMIKAAGSDDSIRTSLREIHDLFHEIEAKCR